MRHKPSWKSLTIGIVVASLLILASAAAAEHLGQPTDAMVGVWALYGTPGDDASITDFLIIEESTHGAYPVTMYGKECGQHEFTPGRRQVIMTTAFDVTDQPEVNPAADAVLYFFTQEQVCGHALAPHANDHAEVNLEWYSNQNHIILDVNGSEYVPVKMVKDVDDAVAFFDKQTRALAERLVGTWVDLTGSPEKLVVFDNDGHYHMTGGGCTWTGLLDFGWFGTAAPDNMLNVPPGEKTFSIVGNLECPGFPGGWDGFQIAYELNEGIKKKFDTLVVHPGGVILNRE